MPVNFSQMRQALLEPMRVRVRAQRRVPFAREPTAPENSEVAKQAAWRRLPAARCLP
jgi:hypothetical protein